MYPETSEYEAGVPTIQWQRSAILCQQIGLYNAEEVWQEDQHGGLGLSQVGSCGFCGETGMGAGFLRVLLFPLPVLNQPTAPHSIITL
jgi:hypothetical protein